MADGRKNNGGHKTAGRKPKAEEEKIKKLSIKAMNEIYGSEEKFFRHGFEKAQESYPYYRLMMEYTYGKPKERKEIKVEEDDNTNFTGLKVLVVKADEVEGRDE